MPSVKRVLPRLKKGQYPTKRQLDRVAGRASDSRVGMLANSLDSVLSSKKNKKQRSLKTFEKAQKKWVKETKKTNKNEKKNLKSINKKPLPARSRSGAASGRGGMRGGVGSGPFGPRVR